MTESSDTGGFKWVMIAIVVVILAVAGLELALGNNSVTPTPTTPVSTITITPVYSTLPSASFGVDFLVFQIVQPSNLESNLVQNSSGWDSIYSTQNFRAYEDNMKFVRFRAVQPLCILQTWG